MEAIIAKVRKGYVLQLGPDQANWVEGPKTIRINDPAVVRGQRHKLEIVSGSLDPVKPVAPARAAPPPFWERGGVELVENVPSSRLDVDSREVQAYDQDRASRPTPAQIMESSNAAAQARARDRQAATEALRHAPATKKHGAVEVIDETPPEPAGPSLTAEEMLRTARPITPNYGETVQVVEDDPTPLERGESPPPPTPQQIAAAPVIGGEVEAGQLPPPPPQAQPKNALPPVPTVPAAPVNETPPPPDGFNVRGVSKERLKLALEIAQGYDPARLQKALATLEGAEKGLIYVMRPPQFRDELVKFHQEHSAEATAEIARLGGELEELRALVQGTEQERDALSRALATEKAKTQELGDELDKALKAAKAPKKKTPKKTTPKKEATKAMNKPEENRQVDSAENTRTAASGKGSGSAARDAAADRKPAEEKK